MPAAQKKYHHVIVSILPHERHQQPLNFMLLFCQVFLYSRNRKKIAQSLPRWTELLMKIRKQIVLIEFKYKHFWQISCFTYVCTLMFLDKMVSSRKKTLFKMVAKPCANYFPLVKQLVLIIFSCSPSYKIFAVVFITVVRFFFIVARVT